MQNTPVQMKEIVTPKSVQKAAARKRSHLCIGVVAILLMLFFSVLALNVVHVTKVHDTLGSTGNTNGSNGKKSNNPNSLTGAQANNIALLRSKINEQKKELEALKHVTNAMLKSTSKSENESNNHNQSADSKAKSTSSSSSINNKIDNIKHTPENLVKSIPKLQQDPLPKAANAKTEEQHQDEHKVEDGDMEERMDSLPGAMHDNGNQHPILLMSDDEFRSTSVDIMLAKYGEANGGGTCKKDFGNELIKQWRNTKKNVCYGVENKETSTNIKVNPYTKIDVSNNNNNNDNRVNNVENGIYSSSAECYLHHQTRHHGNGDNLCVYHDVSMNMAVFDSKSLTTPIVEKYVQTRHVIKPYMKFPLGTIQGKCILKKENGWDKRYMPGWNSDLTTETLQTLPYSSSNNNNVKCDEYVKHKVIMLQRDTFANFFHNSEDFVNLFISLAILKWKPGETQVLLTDLYPEGPFWELWSEAFSWGINSSGSDGDGGPHYTYSDSNNKRMNDGKLPVRTAKHLQWDYGTLNGHKTKNKNSNSNSNSNIAPEYRVCYKDLAVGIYGPASPITVASWNTPCSNTAVVKAYADYIIRGLNLQKYTHYSLKLPSKTIVVTYMARRPSTQWPEKRFCDSKNSFFLCKLWEKFGIRPLQRTIRNDVDVVNGLKSLEKIQYKNGAKVIFNDRDYNLLSIREQIKEDLRTDIMIGPHGAGLMHCVFLRNRGILIELPIDGAAANRHFHNLAFWSGHRYIQGPDQNPVQMEALKNLVINTIESINLNAY